MLYVLLVIIALLLAAILWDMHIGRKTLIKASDLNLEEHQKTRRELEEANRHLAEVSSKAKRLG